jgi:DnaK suppressor protein
MRINGKLASLTASGDHHAMFHANKSSTVGATHPSSTNTAHAQYPQLAQRLRKRKQTLQEEIHDTLLRADAERYAELADRINDIEDRPLAELLAEVSHAEVARDVAEVSDIERALKRIDAGTYGLCLQCHTAIPQERLAAYPTAQRCLPCQQHYENTHGVAAIPKL